MWVVVVRVNYVIKDSFRPLIYFCDYFQCLFIVKKIYGYFSFFKWKWSFGELGEWHVIIIMDSLAHSLTYVSEEAPLESGKEGENWPDRIFLFNHSLCTPTLYMDDLSSWRDAKRRKEKKKKTCPHEKRFTKCITSHSDFPFWNFNDSDNLT